MKVRFWGTRGSLPASINAEMIRKKIMAALETAINKGIDPETDIGAFIDNELPFWIKGTYGTNTSCIEIQDGETFILCDAGSGLRDFGNYILKSGNNSLPGDYHIFISHLHWDHIQGFPFFIPAYIAGNRITIHGCHKDMARIFSVQQSSPSFPMELKKLDAEICFDILTPGRTYNIKGFSVTAKKQYHPGESYGYRFERDGKIIVYSTDSEHKYQSDENSDPFKNFFRGAHLLIFDAQYTLADACTNKADWGHSNNVIGVELAQKSGVRHLCLFHQEPVTDDKALDKLLEDTKKFADIMKKDSPLSISIAWDGMVVEL